MATNNHQNGGPPFPANPSSFPYSSSSSFSSSSPSHHPPLLPPFAPSSSISRPLTTTWNAHSTSSQPSTSRGSWQSNVSNATIEEGDRLRLIGSNIHRHLGPKASSSTKTTVNVERRRKRPAPPPPSALADDEKSSTTKWQNERREKRRKDFVVQHRSWSTAEWLCRKYLERGKRKLDKKRAKKKKSKKYNNGYEEEEEGDDDREGGGRERDVDDEWKNLSQIAHHRARKTQRQRRFAESQQSSMEENSREDDEPKSCKDFFCGKRMKEWAFWFIVAFLAGLTVRDLYNLVKEYMENPKKSDMNVRFNETMRMPNITFCMSREQAWSHFKLNGTENSKGWEAAIATQLKNMTDRESFLKKPWEFGMVMETYNLISTLTSMERETTAHGTVNSIHKFRTQDRLAEIRKMTKFWLAELSKRDVTFEEFLQKVGKETLRRSMQRFQRTTFDEDLVIKTQLTITWLSQVQLCFQPIFDSDNLKPIVDQGEFFVMVLSHNAEKLEGQQVECMSADFHGRPSASSRFMGSKGVMKDGFTDELCMGMMHETTVEIKARYKMLPNDDEGTACRDNEDEEGEDNEWNCYLRCRMEFIRDICNCTAPTLSYLATKKGEDEMEQWPICDYAECQVDVQGRNYSDDECTKNCFRNCDQIRYNIDHERKGKSARPDFTTVVLKWGSFEYLTLEQDWVWSATTFIAAIGGSIGMWLGLSILSLIQGSTYLITYVEHKVVEKRKQRSASITEEPKKLSRVQNHPNFSKIHIDDEDKLATNPFASPFKKMSHASAAGATVGAQTQ